MSFTMLNDSEKDTLKNTLLSFVQRASSPFRSKSVCENVLLQELAILPEMIKLLLVYFNNDTQSNNDNRYISLTRKEFDIALHALYQAQYELNTTDGLIVTDIVNPDDEKNKETFSLNNSACREVIDGAISVLEMSGCKNNSCYP